MPSYIDEDASHSSPLETEKCMMDHHMALFGSFKASIITPSDFVTLTRQSLLSRCECTCTPVCVASSLPESIFIYFICQCSCLTQTLLCRLCKDLFSYYNGSYCNIIIDPKILSKPTELKVLFNSPSPFQWLMLIPSVNMRLYGQRIKILFTAHRAHMNIFYLIFPMIIWSFWCDVT